MDVERNELVSIIKQYDKVNEELAQSLNKALNLSLSFKQWREVWKYYKFNRNIFNDFINWGYNYSETIGLHIEETGR